MPALQISVYQDYMIQMELSPVKILYHWRKTILHYRYKPEKYRANMPA